MQANRTKKRPPWGAIFLRIAFTCRPVRRHVGYPRSLPCVTGYAYYARDEVDRFLCLIRFSPSFVYFAGNRPCSHILSISLNSRLRKKSIAALEFYGKWFIMGYWSDGTPSLRVATKQSSPFMSTFSLVSGSPRRESLASETFAPRDDEGLCFRGRLK